MCSKIKNEFQILDRINKNPSQRDCREAIEIKYKEKIFKAVREERELLPEKKL